MAECVDTERHMACEVPKVDVQIEDVRVIARGDGLRVVEKLSHPRMRQGV